MILFTIALVIVLIGHGWHVVLFVVGGKAVKTAPATNGTHRQLPLGIHCSGPR